MGPTFSKHLIRDFLATRAKIISVLNSALDSPCPSEVSPPPWVFELYVIMFLACEPGVGFRVSGGCLRPAIA